MIKSASSTSPAKIIFTSSNFNNIYNYSFNLIPDNYTVLDVTSTAIHPGFIATNIVNQDQLSNFGKILRNMELLCFAKSPEVGCVNMLYPVFSTDIEDGGKYF